MIALAHINASVMEDLAWRNAFGRAVEAEERGVLLALMAQLYHEKVATALDLLAAICEQARISKPTAKKRVDRCVDLGFIACVVDQNNETRKLYSLGPGVAENLSAVWLSKRQIARIVDAQIIEPENPTAGKDESNSTFYFNAADPKVECMYQDRKRLKKSSFNSN